MTLRDLARLPPFFSGPPFQHLLPFLSSARIFTSFLLLRQGSQSHILLKDGFIYAPLDWQMFSLMRASADFILTSGAVLRAEEGLYQRRQSYRDIQIDRMYGAFLGPQRQNLAVLTRHMRREDVRKAVNGQFYELMDIENKECPVELVRSLAEEENGKILLECGLNFMEGYFRRAAEKGENLVDLVMVSTFSGRLEKRYRGEVFNTDLDALFPRRWQSEEYACDFPGNEKGRLRFQVFSR